MARTLEERSIPEIGKDYCFVRRKVEEESTTVIVIKDRDSKAIRAHALKYKGTCLDEAAQMAADAISAFGYRGKIALKTDTEPALLDLRKEVEKKLDNDLVVVRPLPGESQSNGVIEAGVKTFKGLLRVHLIALERKVDVHVPTAHPLMKWILELATDITAKYLMGSDDKTGHNRLVGKQVHEEQLEFEEKTLCKCRTAQNQGVVLEPRWASGFWLGKSRGSNLRRVLVNPRRVIEVRGIQRVPKIERWDKDALNNIISTPAQWMVPDDIEEP